MPKLDGTGPSGYGQGAGRRMGPCPYGFRAGYGRRFLTKKEETEILREDIEELENELKAAKERLSEMKAKE